MNAFCFGRTSHILLALGVLTVAGLWIAEEAGWLKVAQQDGRVSAQEQLPVPLPVRVTLQGVIAGDESTPGIAILAEAGKRPLLVPEGASFNDDLQVEKVMPDHAVLRQRSSGVTIELPLSLMPGDVPVSLSMSEGQAVTSQWQDEHPAPTPGQEIPKAINAPPEALR